VSCFSLDTYQENQIPERVVEFFYEKLPSDKPVIVRVEAGRFTMEISDLLKQRLIDDGIVLFEKETQEYQLIGVSYYVVPKVVRYKRLFSVVEKRQIAHNFNYQVTSFPEGKIEVYNKITIMSQPVEHKSGMKWYDTLFISAIIGGLAYLLYFGG